MSSLPNEEMLLQTYRVFQDKEHSMANPLGCKMQLESHLCVLLNHNRKNKDLTLLDLRSALLNLPSRHNALTHLHDLRNVHHQDRMVVPPNLSDLSTPRNFNILYHQFPVLNPWSTHSQGELKDMAPRGLHHHHWTSSLGLATTIIINKEYSNVKRKISI